MWTRRAAAPHTAAVPFASRQAAIPPTPSPAYWQECSSCLHARFISCTPLSSWLKHFAPCRHRLAELRPRAVVGTVQSGDGQEQSGQDWLLLPYCLAVLRLCAAMVMAHSSSTLQVEDGDWQELFEFLGTLVEQVRYARLFLLPGVPHLTAASACTYTPCRGPGYSSGR